MCGSIDIAACSVDFLTYFLYLFIYFFLMEQTVPTLYLAGNIQ